MILILQAAVHTLMMKMTDTITEAEQVREAETGRVQEAEQVREVETEQVQETETAEQVQETEQEQIQIRALIREAVKIRVILRIRPAAILLWAEMAAAEMAAEHRR